MQQISLPALILFSTSFLTFVFIVALLFRQERRGARQLAFLLSVLLIYTFGYAMETLSTEPDTIRFWVHVQYLGIPFIPLGLFNFTNFYFRMQGRNLKIVTLSLFFFGLTVMIMEFTHRFHHLYYSDLVYSKFKGFSTFTFTPYFFYHLHSLIQVALMGTFVFFAVRMVLEGGRIYLKRGALLILFVLIPLLTDLAVIVSHFEARVDFVPFTFFLSSIILMYLYLSDSLFSVIPVDKMFILNSLLDGMLIFDRQEVLLYFNDKALEVMPELSEELIGRKLKHAAQRVPFLSSFKFSGSDGATEYEISSATGDQRYIEVRTLSAVSRNESQDLKILIVRDVSEDHRVREDIEAMYRRIAETNRLKSMVIDVLSHDLRSPFVMMGNLRKLMDEKVIEHTPSLLVRGGEELESLIDRADVLVTNMSALDLMDKPENDYPLSDICLGDVLTSLDERLEKLRKKKEMNCTREIQSELVVHAHAFLLKSVLWNVIENAFRFSTPGSSVTLKAGSGRDVIWFEVFNEGTVIDTDVVQMFSQDGWGVKTPGTSGEKGAGIGLYASRKFMTWMGGTFTLEPVAMTGTRARLEFLKGVNSAGEEDACTQ